MAEVLFLAPDDLGEVVLATGALAHVLADGDTLSISASLEAQALFREAPATLRWLAPRLSLGWWAAAGFAGRRWDVVVDGRGDWMCALVAGRRVALRPQTSLRHRAEDWTEAAAAAAPLAPRLWIGAAARRAAAAAAPDAALLVLAPGGASAAKRWPGDRYAAVARRLADGPLAQARVIVLGAAARDAPVAAAIVSSLDADGLAAADLGSGLDLAAAAALLERATLCIGNDNVLTHIAAAMGAPTLTLFGPTDERVRAPYGPRVRTLRGRSLEAIAAPGEGRQAMEDIGIDAAEAAALDLLHAGGLR